LNVLLVIEGTYPWYRGGVSEWIYRYIKTCTEFNFSILQIATDPFFDLKPEDALYPLPDNILNFKRIPPPEFVDNWEASLNNWFSDNSPHFEDIMDYEIIHVTNTGFAGWLGVQISKVMGKPLILTEHAIYWLEVLKGAVALECGYRIPDNTISKERVVTLFKDIAKSVYLNADKIITVSECNIKLQKQLGATSITYIPNGIPDNWISNTIKKRKIPVIGWVGRCAEMKNPLQFFDYISEFQRQGFKAQFLMLLSDAGEHGLEVNVKEKALSFDSVSLVWNKPSKEYYKEMDMLLITSHNESQPLVMFEALSQKVLPIGREVGDLTNKFGYTFPEHDSIDTICKEIHEFWETRELFTNYVEERHAVIKSNHTWSNIFNQYEIMINETILELEELK